MSALVRVAASPLVRASFRTLRPSRGCARPRRSPAHTRYVRAASSAGTRDESPSACASDAADPAPDISKRDLLRTSAAVRLSSYVYKKGDVEPWVTRDGFVLRAQGNTECTRWFVCDELEAENETETVTRQTSERRETNDSEALQTKQRLTRRWFIVRGAAWNDDAVDSVRLSTQIARAWPVPLHEGVPVVCHAGVAEMTEQFWPEIEPWIRDLQNHPRASASFAGHSLGGSMATLLMAWALHRCGVAVRKIEPARTFGSPPVLAADRWAMRRESIVAGAGVSAERVARELASGGDWVAELAAAVGVPGAVGGVALDATNARSGSETTSPASSTNVVRRSGTETTNAETNAESSDGSSPGVTETYCALRLAGFAPDAVRAFVLSNDPVPRMWLSADPFFSSALANETVRGVLRSREALFGAGVFSTERFLYEAVGTLYWLKWSPAGTTLVVHEHDDVFFEEELTDDAAQSAEGDDGRRLSVGGAREGDTPRRAASISGGHARRLKMAPPWEGDLAQSLRAAFDHNAGNYVDAVQWLALKKLNLSKSANL